MTCLAQSEAQQEYLNSDVEVQHFDKEKWAKAVEGVDYTDEKKRKEKKKKDYDLPSSFFGDMSWIKYLFYVLGIIGLGILLYYIIQHTMLLQGGQKKNDKAYTIEDAEDNLLETDLQRFLKEALAKGDYKMAIRVYYLEILKQLSLKKQIKWQRDKTNNEYLREMRKQDHFKDFRSVTRTFERAWYGDATIGKDVYAEISPEFERYLGVIG